MRLHGVHRRSRWRRALLFLTAILLIISLLAVAQVAPWRRQAAEQTVSGENASPRPITRFSIGAFLNNLTPSNTSHCNFPLGMGENFSVPEELVSGSPELGDKSTYRVVYTIINGKAYNESKNSLSVTFATHATLEYVVHIAEIARTWQGPVSVACYLPGADLTIGLKILETLCYCEPAMRNVSVHLVFHAEYPPNVTFSSRNSSDTCIVPKKMLRSQRPLLRLPYPVNVARNVARQAVRTEYLLVADIELFPSADLAKGFLDMLLRLPKRLTGEHSFLKKRHVYVVPVFEVVADVRRLPRTKRELLNLHANDRAVYFHRFVCLHCQRFPGLLQWLQRKDNPRRKPQLIQPMLVVKREFPHHRWEPVYIGTQREPLYSELLTWEGQQDKMAQMYEMCLLDYRFIILDGAFLVHSPGVKHRKTKDKPNNNTGSTTVGLMEPTQRSQQVKRNSYLYRLITDDLTSRYGYNRKCRRN